MYNPHMRKNARHLMDSKSPNIDAADLSRAPIAEPQIGTNTALRSHSIAATEHIVLSDPRVGAAVVTITPSNQHVHPQAAVNR